MQSTETRQDGKQQKPEINQYTMKWIVGVIAFSLPFLTNYFSSTPLTSISASYWAGGWSQTIFIGFLFAIASFLLAFDGDSPWEAAISKVAAIAAIGVSMFPCACDGHEEMIRYVHWGSALVMFSILACFCVIFAVRAWKKRYSRARLRAGIYVVCCLVIVGAILVLGYDGATKGSLSAKFPTLTFWSEAVGLGAFGVSWFVASHLLGGLLFNDKEWYYPLRKRKMPAEPSVA
jgi:hypothetical protein